MTSTPGGAGPKRQDTGRGTAATITAGLPTVADWEPVFDEAGWELVRTDMIDLTVGEVIFELE